MSLSTLQRSRSQRINKACFETLEDRRLMSFTPAVSYAADTGPTGVVTADFNNDGHLDLVTAGVGSVSFRPGRLARPARCRIPRKSRLRLSLRHYLPSWGIGACYSYSREWRNRETSPNKTTAVRWSADGRVAGPVVNIAATTF
jgi:hypothetical protein